MLTLALVFLVAVSKLEAAEINCENFERYKRFEKCCFLSETAEISEANVTIADLENPDVEAILFDNNKKTQFLPVNVYEKFPNLEVYLAVDAAVKEILALNFARLINLKLLELQRNQIESVPDNCFQGLTKLYKINLSN